MDKIWILNFDNGQSYSSHCDYDLWAFRDREKGQLLVDQFEHWQAAFRKAYEAWLDGPADWVEYEDWVRTNPPPREHKDFKLMFSDRSDLGREEAKFSLIELPMGDS